MYFISSRDKTFYSAGCVVGLAGGLRLGLNSMSRRTHSRTTLACMHAAIGVVYRWDSKLNSTLGVLVGGATAA